MFCHRANPSHYPCFLLRTFKIFYWLSDETKISVCTFSLVNAVFSLSWMRSGILPEYTPLPQAAWSFIPNCKVLAKISFPYIHGGGESRGKSQKTPGLSVHWSGAGGSHGTQVFRATACSQQSYLAGNQWRSAHKPTWNSLASCCSLYEGSKDTELESQQGECSVKSGLPTKPRGDSCLWAAAEWKSKRQGCGWVVGDWSNTCGLGWCFSVSWDSKNIEVSIKQSVPLMW